MKKQLTAVEWFENELDKLDIIIPQSIFAEAKEIEKEQIRKYNVLLEKAPEMLDMLKKLVDRMEENNLGNFPSVIKAKDLIKKATELN